MAEVKGANIQEKESKASLIATISCALLILAVNLPLYVAQVLSSNTGKSRVNKEGLIILLVAIGAAVLIYLKKQKYIIAPSIIVICVLVHYYLYIPTLEEYSCMTYGYYIQWLSAIGMIVSVFMLPKKGKTEGDESESSGVNAEATNDSFKAKDLRWVAGCIIVSVLVLFLFDKRIMFTDTNSSEFEQVEAGTEDNITEDVEDITETVTTEVREEYDFIGEECCVNIDDAFLLNYRSNIVVVVKYFISNISSESISFANYIITDVSQNEIYLQSVSQPDISLFDFTSATKNMNNGESCYVHMAYELINEYDNINVNLMMANEPTITVCTKDVELNKVYMVNNGDEQESVDETEEPVKTDKPSNNKATKKPTDKSSVVTSAPAVPDEPQTPVVTETPKKTATPTVAPTPVPTPEPTSFTVYFNKPSSWGNDIKAYVYSLDNESLQEISGWPGIGASSSSNGTYSWQLDNSWNGKYIIFNDGSNQYPGSGETGYIIEKGKTYSVP